MGSTVIVVTVTVTIVRSLCVCSHHIFGPTLTHSLDNLLQVRAIPTIIINHNLLDQVLLNLLYKPDQKSTFPSSSALRQQYEPGNLFPLLF